MTSNIKKQQKHSSLSHQSQSLSMKKNIILESICKTEYDDFYSDIPENWKYNKNDLESFSKDKPLFDYQKQALKNISTTLYYYYGDKTLKEKYDEKFQNEGIQEHIQEYNINRACFWMATGSGKSLVLIKVIEQLNNLIEKKLISNNDILLLFPKEELLEQIREHVEEYNIDRNVKIELHNLKDYGNVKSQYRMLNNVINVFYCKTDLLREERKENQLDYKDYVNNGNWYVLLDEAHRGENNDKMTAKIKQYIKEFTENGFLFNFSATFTDDIDKITTCFNFNLNKFNENGYGKNIYISDTIFTFKDNQKTQIERELNEEEKKIQILKSLIVFTLIKQSRKDINYYHNPLIITLCNSINKATKNKEYKEDSDLYNFLKYLIDISNNEHDYIEDSLNRAKEGLHAEFNSEDNYKEYLFNREQFSLKRSDIESVTIDDIRESVFNTRNIGSVQYYKNNEEIVLQLETSDKPFAIINIGDVDTFVRCYLIGCKQLEHFDNKKYMENINDDDSSINLLLGSRKFYEGWDSNRPNIINLINIGSGDAKKYIPQSIGRGVRIQPEKQNISNRKRLKDGDDNKNKLLETLFIFPTNKEGVTEILTSMSLIGNYDDKNKNIKKINLYDEIKLPERFNNVNNSKSNNDNNNNNNDSINSNNDYYNDNDNSNFILKVPQYGEDSDIKKTIEYRIKNKEYIDNYLNSIDSISFILQNHRSYNNSWTLEEYNRLMEYKNNDKIVKDETGVSLSIWQVLEDLKMRISTGKQVLQDFRSIEDDDISHYKNIEVSLSEEDIEEFKNKIIDIFEENTKESPTFDVNKKDDVKYMEKYLKKLKMKNDKQISFLEEIYISSRLEEHYYYNPLIYSNPSYSNIDGLNYINHIIKVQSESEFITNLIKYVDSNNIDFQWKFSKIDESIDKIFIPYFNENSYNRFFPDFIFWLKHDNEYKIIFVDPKGVSKGIDKTERKIDGFNDIFETQKDILKRNKIEVELVLIGNGQVGEGYKKYWRKQEDFSWFKI